MAVLDDINSAIAWLEKAKQELAQSESTQADPPQSSVPEQQIAWGSKVSPEFKKRVLWIADQLSIDPSWLMACMAWESGRTFRSDIKNAAGSGAVGLIQFMPTVAKKLGTTSELLKAMSAEDQLRFVYEYFKPWVGRLHNLGDVYMAILWPAAIGHEDNYVLFNRSRAPLAYRENAGLDGNHDGLVTRGECLIKLNDMLRMGMLPTNAG